MGARPVTLTLEDRSAAGCPGEAELRARVALLLRDEVGFDEDADRDVKVAVERHEDRLRATIQLLERGAVAGERILETEPDDCPALMAAVALNLVLAIDPMRGMELATVEHPPVLPEGTKAPEEPPDSAPVVVVDPEEPAPPPPPPPAEVPDPAPPMWIETGGYGVTSFGITPGIGGGGSLDLALRRGWWSVAVEGRGLLPSSAEHAGGEVDANLLAGGAWGCARYFGFGACAGGLMGVQVVGGDGFVDSRDAVAEVAYLGFRGFTDVALGDEWAVRLWGEAIGPVGTTRLTVSGREAWESAVLVGAFGLGAVWQIRLSDGNGPDRSTSD